MYSPPPHPTLPKKTLFRAVALVAKKVTFTLNNFKRQKQLKVVKRTPPLQHIQGFRVNLIFVSVTGGASGAQTNPAVSVTLWAAGLIILSRENLNLNLVKH